MSLPPGFLDELRSRVTLSAIVGRKVTWDLRKSNMPKGDWWAPCPFHQEKSASFHVDDRKGFYYCFGCQAKGDVVTFMIEAENLPFIEAVKVLASEAGMQLPDRDPRAAEKADRKSQLHAVMEEAVKWYRLQLKTQAASDARAYLEKRGLTLEAQERWEIGFAPDGWRALYQALTAKGIEKDLLVASGLCALGTKGTSEPYDRFRNRIIFPIRDARGRAISFGGRAMDPNDNAKYLNGPETELFDKGRNLFNQGPAREAAGKGQPLIVAEGYMDVIALSEAGFKAAVAPLGTAVTEEQLRLLWRISPEPLIALDGDSAGIRAALRVVDLALPLLEAGKGLRFALMPDGMDPDDLIKRQGADAMEAVLAAAQPMVSLLWERETKGKTFDSPERKAALDLSLRNAISRIQDRSIREHYGQEIKELRWELFRRGRKPTGGPKSAWGGKSSGFQPSGRGPNPRFQPIATPNANTVNSLLARAEDNLRIEDRLKEAVILATLLRFPALIARFENGLERLEFHGDDHERLRNLLLTHGHQPNAEELIENDSPGALAQLLANPHVKISPSLGPRADETFAGACVEEAMARLQADRAHRIELAEAQEDVTGLVDEGLTYRVSKAAEARISASRGPKEQKTESFIAPNGVELSREELDRARKIHDSIDFTRGGRPRRP